MPVKYAGEYTPGESGNSPTSELDYRGRFLDSIKKLSERVRESQRMGKDDAIKSYRSIAEDMLELRSGMRIPVYAASVEDGTVSRFYVKFLQRRTQMRAGEDVEIPLSKIISGLRRDDINEMWNSAEEEAKKGAGEGIFAYRLRSWTELADALKKAGFRDRAEQIVKTRDRIADFAASRGLERFRHWDDPNFMGEDGIAFCGISEKNMPEHFLEVALHEGTHIWEHRITRDKSREGEFLERRTQLRSMGFLDRLKDDLLQSIFTQLKAEGSFTDEDIPRALDENQMGFPVELSNETFTGEGLASYMSPKLMHDLGLQPQIKYKEKNPRYYVGMCMWDSVMKKAKDNGVTFDQVLGCVLKPYTNEHGKEAVIGIVELFQNREKLGEFIKEHSR
ncbi:MAG: hypothetical protein V1744_06530 [Candidatus Altiarchaeota archaeon]